MAEKYIYTTKPDNCSHLYQDCMGNCWHCGIPLSPGVIEDEDPTPYCIGCGAMERKHCDCPDPFYADNH